MSARGVDTEQETFQQALVWARSVLPVGTRVRDLSDPCADYTLGFDFITEFDPAVAPELAKHSCIVWTKGSWNARLSKGDSRGEVQRAIAEHLATLSDVYSDRTA